MHEFRTSRRIEFADTDMAGIVHFARFFVFMETAEHEFLDALGSPVHFEHAGRKHGWPRVAAKCEYRSPARLGDVLEIRVRVKRKGRSSMTYRIDFRKGNVLMAEGEITSICCALPRSDDEHLEPVPIPAFLADKLEEAPSLLEATPG